jgi:endonuclease III
VDRRLHRQYAAASLGNQEDPLDELVFIQLSIRTPDSYYAPTFEAFRRLIGGRWERLLELSDEQILPVLESSGMARVKLVRLRGQIRQIIERFGSASLDELAFESDRAVESFLRSLPGVGPKTARCVMLYSLGREVFPVDSHCLRILRRLGLVPFALDRKLAHDVAQTLVPKEIRYTLHVSLVHHGRAVCRTSPICAVCPLLDICPTGTERERERQCSVVPGNRDQSRAASQ